MQKQTAHQLDLTLTLFWVFIPFDPFISETIRAMFYSASKKYHMESYGNKTYQNQT